jgi:hypothetical protein
LYYKIPPVVKNVLKNKSLVMPSNTITTYLTTGTVFGCLRPKSGHQHSVLKRMHPPYFFTLWNSTSLQLLLQYEILKYQIPKLIMAWIPRERRKRGRPTETWTERVQTAMTKRKLEPDYWRNRDEWRLFSGRW